jgi:hypothetical protein
MQSFYQDRLGTNIGKAPKRVPRFLRFNTDDIADRVHLRAASFCMQQVLSTMLLPLIGQHRSIFIGNLGLYWIYFDRIIANA